MNLPKDPRQLTLKMIERSVCAVKVGAVISDAWGIHAWGHNHAGSSGLGEHAEIMCLKRANWRRLPNSTLWVAAIRERTGKPVTAKPCLKCQEWIVASGCGGVVYRDGDGEWRVL